MAADVSCAQRRAEAAPAGVAWCWEGSIALVGRESTGDPLMQEDTPGSAATCLRGPLRRACALFLAPEGRAVSGLSPPGRIYQGEAARLLERYPNARAQGQLVCISRRSWRGATRTRARRGSSIASTT